jgi:hypothetical protein
MEEEGNPAPFILLIWFPDFLDPLDQKSSLGEGIGVGLQWAVLHLEGHCISVAISFPSENAALEPGLVNNERSISFYRGWPEHPRSVEWVGNCQDELPLGSENPASLHHCLLESFDVLEAHERDHTIGNGVWEWERNSISHHNIAQSLGMSGRRSSEHP